MFSKTDSKNKKFTKITEISRESPKIPNDCEGVRNNEQKTREQNISYVINLN